MVPSPRRLRPWGGGRASALAQKIGFDRAGRTPPAEPELKCLFSPAPAIPRLCPGTARRRAASTARQ